MLALVKDLYEAGAENRDFLLARCQAEAGDGAALESYRKKIVEQFFPARGEGKLRRGEARKAIRDYRAIESPYHMRDLHATLLRLMGLDDLLLAFYFNGRNYRLTENGGQLIEQGLS